MTVRRDPGAMSRDELVAYFDGGGDVSELLRGAVIGPDLGPAPDPATIPMIVAGRGPALGQQRDPARRLHDD